MPLPERVIEQLGREPSKTQGWTSGAFLFSGGLLFLTVIIYFGLTLGYEPYLNGQISKTQDQISALDRSISTNDEKNLLNFYSQIANLKTLLGTHTISSRFFSWLEKNTEANVYYQSLELSAGGRVILTGNAKTEADVNQQVAIFENSPEVQSVSISSVAAAQTGTGFDFNALLTMNPSLLSQSATTTQP